MKALILGLSQAGDKPVESPKALVVAMEQQGLQGVESATYDQLLFTLSAGKALITLDDTDIAAYDAVLFTDWFARKRPYADTAFAVASYLKARGVPFVNTEVLSRSQGKVSQYTLFALEGLPMPKTIVSHNIPVLFGEAQQVFGVPFIVKASVASRGSHNYLVDSADKAKSLMQELQPLQETMVFCAQEFLPNDGDYRFVVMNGQTQVVIYRRGSDGSHLNNTSAGGAAELVKGMPDAWKRLAEQAAMLLRREVSGVDLLVPKGSDQPILLEVNNMPQLATGTFVSEKTSALYNALQALAESKE